jgi:hypothetical protein
MSQRVMMYGSLKTASFWGPMVIGVVGVIIGGIAGASGEREVMQIAGGIGAGLVLISVFVALWRISRRQWIEVADSSFIITGHGGRREVADDQVRHISEAWQHEYPDGTLKASTCQLQVWSETPGGTRELKLQYRNEADTPNPVGDLASRLGELLFEKAKADLEAGQAVIGDGWSLQRDGLHFGKADMIAFTELGAVDDIDGHLCAWRKGEENPAIRIPLGSKNACLLTALLAEHLPDEDEEEELSAGNWGRVIFERKASRWPWWTLSALLLIPGVVLLVVEGGAIWPVGAGALVLSVFFGWLAARMRRAGFRCMAYGVCKAGPFGEKRLRYEDVGVFTYNAVRNFYNGGYTGTAFRLAFEPMPERGGSSIVYGVQIHGVDAELEGLREHISGVIGHHMVQRLAMGQTVPWTKGLTLKPAELEYTPSGFFGMKDPVAVPYTDIAGININEGVFFAWVGDEDEPSIQEQMSAPNFFPGLAVLQEVCGAAQGGGDEDDQEEAEEASP